MLRILTTTTLAAALTLPLAAQAQIANMSELIRTRDITGGPIYSISPVYDEDAWANADDASWDAMNWQENHAQIGEIEDIVLDENGQMVGIVAEIGGFLDIGDKHVVVPVADLRMVPVDDTSFSYITRLSEEQLEQMDGVDEGFWD
ncbi:MAG: PRC-barrel domain-containing protein [Pseudomonadota bacterium]